jgi:hypothetical protein
VIERSNTAEATSTWIANSWCGGIVIGKATVAFAANTRSIFRKGLSGAGD